MAELIHNETPAPSFTRGDTVVPREILASYSPPPLVKGITLAPGQGILPAGCAMARKTSDKLWYLYDTGGSGGLETCRGFLLQARDTGTETTSLPVMQGNIVMRGTLYISSLSGVDADAITFLNARQDTIFDYFIF